MECKYCGAQLEEGMETCPVCGKEAAAEPVAEETAVRMQELEIAPETEPEADAEQPVAETAEENGEEPMEEAAEEVTEAVPAGKNKKLRTMMILAIVGCVLLLGVLVAAVLYGLGVDLRPRANDIFFRDSYTVEDQKAAAKADVVVATVGDLELTNSELQVYYWMTVSDFLNNYSYYLSYIGLDYNQPLSEQMCYFDDTKTWEQFLLENAISTWHRYSALTIKAKEEGYEMTQVIRDLVDSMEDTVEKTSVDAGYESGQEMLKTEMGAGCTMEGYLDFWEDYYYGMDYFNSVYETLLPTDEEAEAYFKANEAVLAASGITKDAGRYADVRHILIVPQGGTTDENNQTVYSDAEWEACLKEAEKVYEEWKKGAATEESFAELANKYSKDPGSNTNGGLYEQIYPGQMVETFENWSLDAGRKYGDHGMVKSPYGYHIMYFVDGEDIWLAETKTTILSERTTQMVEQVMEQWTAEVNYKKIVLGQASLTN